MSKSIKWKDIKYEYENTFKSIRRIAKEHGITHGAIQKRAGIENWIKPNKEVKDLAVKMPFLGSIASRKIKELVEEIGDNYSPLDEPLIMIFAQNYEMWIDLQSKIKLSGITCTSEKGGSYLSAEFNAMKSIEKTLLNISNHFGFSVSSRKRIGIEAENTNDKDSIFNINIDELYYDLDV